MGVAAADITELDWWDSTRWRLTLTPPPRHFSGRGLGGRTARSGAAGPCRANGAYYSGDTALQDEFVEIGRRLGPFDLTMIETRADALGPMSTSAPSSRPSHRLVRGDVMLPLHWGTFDLALHGWTEPIERASRQPPPRVRIATPRPGHLRADDHVPTERWWPTLPWHTAAEAPINSTGVSIKNAD